MKLPAAHEGYLKEHRRLPAAREGYPRERKTVPQRGTTKRTYIIHDAERGTMTKVHSASLESAIRRYLAEWFEDITPDVVRTMEDLNAVCGDMGITVFEESELETL